jgi:hypothetical protein
MKESVILLGHPGVGKSVEFCIVVQTAFLMGSSGGFTSALWAFFTSFLFMAAVFTAKRLLARERLFWVWQDFWQIVAAHA